MIYNIRMTLEQDLFQYFQVQFNKLTDYGFSEEDGTYLYRKEIMNGQFIAEVEVSAKGHVSGRVIDSELNEEYVLIRNSSRNSFAADVRNEYLEILKDIALKCFKAAPFISDQANMINDHVYQLYGSSADNPFKKDYRTGVFRNQNSRKWYGIIMALAEDKIFHNGKDGLIEILSIKVKPENLEKYLQIPNVFPAYHLNKKHWISVVLDSTVDFETICRLINESYGLTEARSSRLAAHDWLLPANPEYFDVLEAFEHQDTLSWPVKKRMSPNDIVYIYYSAPYSAIMMKTLVVDVDEDKVAAIKLLETYDKDKYTLKELKAHGCNTVRFITRIPHSLKEYLESDA